MQRQVKNDGYVKPSITKAAPIEVKNSKKAACSGCSTHVAMTY